MRSEKILTLATFSLLGNSFPSQGKSPHLMSRCARCSCLLGPTFGASAYTKFLTEPRNRGSNITLGSASNASLALYQFGMPPIKTSEFVANLPNWNSFPRESLLCDTPSTVRVVRSSLRSTCKKNEIGTTNASKVT